MSTALLGRLEGTDLSPTGEADNTKKHGGGEGRHVPQGDGMLGTDSSHIWVRTTKSEKVHSQNMDTTQPAMTRGVIHKVWSNRVALATHRKETQSKATERVDLGTPVPSDRSQALRPHTVHMECPEQEIHRRKAG